MQLKDQATELQTKYNANKASYNDPKKAFTAAIEACGFVIKSSHKLEYCIFQPENDHFIFYFIGRNVNFLSVSEGEIGSITFKGFGPDQTPTIVYTGSAESMISPANANVLEDEKNLNLGPITEPAKKAAMEYLHALEEVRLLKDFDSKSRLLDKIFENPKHSEVTSFDVDKLDGGESTAGKVGFSIYLFICLTALVLGIMGCCMFDLNSPIIALGRLGALGVLGGVFCILASPFLNPFREGAALTVAELLDRTKDLNGDALQLVQSTLNPAFRAEKKNVLPSDSVNPIASDPTASYQNPVLQSETKNLEPTHSSEYPVLNEDDKNIVLKQF
jgi:hypothetical protein